MKLITQKNRNLLLVILALALFGCYDDKMEWGVPDGHLPVDHSEIPLELFEKIANYDFIRNYVPEGMILGAGIGADLYLSNEKYKQVVDENFQMITLGNAMKHSSVVRNNGQLDFTTIDAFFNAIPNDMRVYGHTLLWHTQQRQTYLKSLIAPEVIVISDPDETVENIIRNFDFESGNIEPWNSWGNSSSRAISAQGEGYNSDYALVLTNPTDANAYSAQAAYDLDGFLINGTTYAYQFWAKSDVGAGLLQFQVQNGTSYGSQEGYKDFNVGTSWVLCEGEFTCSYDDVDRVVINFGKVAGTYFIDNFKFGKKIEPATEMKHKAKKASNEIIYVYKTPEEKKDLLLAAMKDWIEGILTHCGDKVSAWDVINEPIADNSLWRGIDGSFMGEDGEPVEDEGLNLNWDTDHFYWGYYIGKEYAVKAFEYARKYAPSTTKLFVNDYNLEQNESKLNALIDFVNYIEDNGQTVDGIGTQMHVSADTTETFKARVDNMFQTLAATGKLVRVTEFDVQVGTSTPSAGQVEVQALTYQYVIESYLKHIPEGQRSGITIWGLTDDPKEHEYWLPDDAPNLFNKDFSRKHAYKNVCDALAGRDVSKDFTGDDYGNIYKKEEEEE